MIKPNDGTIITSGMVTDGTAGQKYVLGYGSEINLMQDLEWVEKNLMLQLQIGGKVNTKNITIHGAESNRSLCRMEHINGDNGSNPIATAVPGAATLAKSIIKVDGDIILDHADGEIRSCCCKL